MEPADPGVRQPGLPPRLVSIFFGLTVLFLTFHLARALFNRTTALLSCALAAVNWYLFHEAKVVHTNTASLAFALCALYAALMFNRSRSGWWVVLSACSFALALTSKLLEVFFVFPLLFHPCWTRWSGSDQPTR
ncbi:MAG: ArnT family glycosyltransferase [Spirochaetota bacterium]